MAASSAFRDRSASRLALLNGTAVKPRQPRTTRVERVPFDRLHTAKDRSNRLILACQARSARDLVVDA